MVYNKGYKRPHKIELFEELPQSQIKWQKLAEKVR
jgi:hypothetical protein